MRLSKAGLRWGLVGSLEDVENDILAQNWVENYLTAPEPHNDTLLKLSLAGDILSKMTLLSQNQL